MVLLQPVEAFTVMKTEGGIGEPLIYGLIGGCAGAIVSFLFSFAFQSLGFMADQRHGGLGMLVGMGAGSIAMVILVPLMVAAGLFIGSGIIHLCLMMVGGAKKPFETTFRVLAFSQGSTGPIQMIPFCGGMIAGVWALVCNCIGLARAHEIDTGRAVVAVLLPMVICCGAIFIGVAIFAGGIGALMQHNQ